MKLTTPKVKMQLSKQGLECLQCLESCRLTPYDDRNGKSIEQWCPGATIGYGHLIREQHWPKFRRGISPIEAVDVLAYDVRSFERAVRYSVDANDYLQRQFDAMVLLAFNIGCTAFKNSSVVSILTGKGKSNYGSLEGAWKAWNRYRGKKIQGLVNRRRIEWNFYNGIQS